MTSKPEDIEGIDELPYALQQNPRWAAERNRILRSLEKDAEGLPMTTSQRLLMERMSTSYAVTRMSEASADYTPSIAERRALDDQWLKMTSEFNKQLTVGEDKRRSAMIDTILTIIKDAVSMIEDTRIREDLRKRLEIGFSDAGL